MVKTLITDKGKEEVLRLAFKGASGFNYIALGGANSSGAQANGQFVEITDSSYRRQKTEINDTTVDDKNIVVSATFNETNLNSSQGELIKEIGIVNSSEPTSAETFFAYCEVPNIVKDDSISLKYSVIIEIE